MTKYFSLFALVAISGCPTDYNVHIVVDDAGVITGTAHPIGGASGQGAGKGGALSAGAGGASKAGSGGFGGSIAGAAGHGGTGTQGAPVSGQGGTAGSAPAPLSGFSVGTQSWYVASWSGSNLYNQSVPWATAWSSGMNIWNPQFIADMAPYSTFRHMDTNSTNDSTVTSWSQRTLPTDPKQQEIYIDGQSAPGTAGLAVEWQVDLCNRANVDCWFTVPFLADDDYVTNEYALVKNLLKPGLKNYWELGNENWNGGFRSFQQAIDAGVAGGLPGDNKWYQGIAYAMYRTLQMGKIVGTGAGTGRILVFAESGNLDLGTQAFKNVYQSSKWNPDHVTIDMLALAPYVGSGVDGADPNVIQKFRAEVDGFVAGEPIAWGQRDAKANGVPLLGCYEAGATYTTNADKFSQNPASYDAYFYMLSQFSTRMNGPCNIYTLYGRWASSQAWGSYDSTGQPLSQAHKARAIADFVKMR